MTFGSKTMVSAVSPPMHDGRVVALEPHPGGVADGLLVDLLERQCRLLS